MEFRLVVPAPNHDARSPSLTSRSSSSFDPRSSPPQFTRQNLLNTDSTHQAQNRQSPSLGDNLGLGSLLENSTRRLSVSPQSRRVSIHRARPAAFDAYAQQRDSKMQREAEDAIAYLKSLPQERPSKKSISSTSRMRINENGEVENESVRRQSKARQSIAGSSFPSLGSRLQGIDESTTTVTTTMISSFSSSPSPSPAVSSSRWIRPVSRDSTRTAVSTPLSASFSALSPSVSRESFSPHYQRHTVASIRASSPMMVRSSLSNRAGVSQWAVHLHNQRHAFDFSPLMVMMKSPQLDVRRQAVSMLATLSLGEDNHQAMVDKNLVSSLLNYSESSDHQIRTDAYRAIAHLSQHEMALFQIAELSGVQVLMNTLEDSDPSIRALGLAALDTLAQTEQYALDMVDDENFATIMCIMKGKNADCRRLCAQLLCSLANYQNVCILMVRLGIMKEFVGVFKSKDVQTKKLCLQSLTKILASGNFTLVAMEAEIQIYIMEMIHTHKRPEKDDSFFISCLQALYELAQDAAVVQWLMGLHVFSILFESIRNKNLEVQREGARVLSAMASHAAFCDMMVQDEKIITSIAHMGYSNNKKIKCFVAKTLRNLVEAGHAKALYAMNATTALFSLCKVFEQDTQLDVACALGGILTLDFIPPDERTIEFHKLVQLGAMEAIVHITDLDSYEIRSKLSFIIRRFCEHVQNFERSSNGLMTAITKLFELAEPQVVDNLTRALYLLTSSGRHNRAINDAGIGGLLYRYSMSKQNTPMVVDLAQRTIDLLEKDIDEIKSSKQRDRTRRQSGLLRQNTGHVKMVENV